MIVLPMVAFVSGAGAVDGADVIGHIIPRSIACGEKHAFSF